MLSALSSRGLSAVREAVSPAAEEPLELIRVASAPARAPHAAPRPRSALQTPRASAPNRPVVRDTLVPRTGLSEIYYLDIEGRTLGGRNARFDIPLMSESEAAGRGLLPLRASLDNVVMPDGTHVSSGGGNLTLVVERGRVVGLLQGSVTFTPETLFLSRESARGVSLQRGTLLTQAGQVLGIGPDSEATFNGVRVRSSDRVVNVSSSDGVLYRLSTGARVVATPADRAVHLAGTGITLRTTTAMLDLDNGSVVVDRTGAARIELGTARNVRELPDPPIANRERERLASGRIVLRREPGQLFVNGVSHRDVDQGLTGDCWFIGSVLAIAAMRPELLQPLITDNRDNTYGVRMYRNGKWETVTVDDDFYVHTDGGRPNNVYASSRTPGELWGPILEKAHAATRPNGYQGLWAAGYPADAFRELTGRASDVRQHADLTEERLFDLINRNAHARLPMATVAGVPYTDDADLERRDAALRARNGLRNWHVYAIMGTQIEDGQRYVVLRNTAGDTEFRTNAYSTDVTIDGTATANDGYFRVRMDDFRREFAQTTTLQLSGRAS